MNIAQLLTATLRQVDPQRVALADPDGSRTFGDFTHRLAALTTWLRSRGFGPGQRIGILSRNSIDYLEAWWSVIAIGATAVPLNFRLVAAELRRIIAANPLSACFCSAELVGLLGEADDCLAEKPVIVWGGDVAGMPFEVRQIEDLVAQSRCELEVTAVADEAPFSIIYTGGTSTGSPKGVIRTHGNATAHAFLAPGHNFSGRRRTVLCSTPLFHAAGQIGLFNLLVGGAVVLSGRGFDTRQFLELVNRYQVEAAFVVPTIVIELTQITGVAHVPSLRELRCGSAPLPLEVARRLVAKFPGVWFGNGAGSTEAGTYAVVGWEEMSAHPYGCVGRAPLGQEVRIFSEQGAELAPDGMGEIVIRGGQVSPGFWGQPERTTEVFREGWLKTGDLGWIDQEGLLYLVDRKDDLIISGGENVYAREIEEILYAVSGVAEAAVVAMGDPRWGEVPVAAVVAAPGASPLCDIESALEQKLARYKHPRKIVLFEWLPKTAVGKIDKRELRARFRQITPEPAA
ncbi:MAG: acyl--CoA ligase [Pseudomonadota bacterium]|nr:acyl--CoA ligase [Pseudomonadota bacterium]